MTIQEAEFLGGQQDLGHFLRRINSPTCPFDPNRIAIKYEDISYTYLELNRQVNRLANGLLNFGIQKGDRVGALLYNCIEYFEIFYAVAKIGAVIVPINFRLVPREVVYVLNDAGAKVLIYDKSFQNVVDGIASELTSVGTYISVGGITSKMAYDYSNMLTSQPESEPPVDYAIGIDDLHLILYTSGTTGRPKGVMFTHGTELWFSILQVVEHRYTSSDIILLTGPLYHVSSLQDFSLPTVNVGGTLIIYPSMGFDIRKVLEVIAKEKVTVTLLFPAWLAAALALPDISKYNLDSLRLLCVGGEPIPSALAKKFHDLYPKAGFFNAYGLTEGPCILSTTKPDDTVEKQASCGKPWLNTEVHIVDEEGEEMPTSKVGELLCRSPAVNKGYWRNPEATAQTFGGGWCHTGDMARIDDDGYIWYSGRKKDVIRSGGENISAGEVEEVLYSYPKVLEAAVIGVPDPKWKEVPLAVVVLKEGAETTVEEIIDYCRENLAHFKCPRYVQFVNSLPRTPSQKVMKYVLREKYGGIGGSVAGDPSQR